MRSPRWYVAGLLVVFLVALAGPASADTALRPAPDAGGYRLLTLMNAARAQIGVPPLTLHPAPMMSAQRYATLLASVRARFPNNSRLWHTFGGTTVKQRIQAAGCAHPRTWGENLAVTATADRVFTMFMSEPPTPDGHRWHREQILNRKFTQVGIWHATSPDGTRTYWITDFTAGC